MNGFFYERTFFIFGIVYQPRRHVWTVFGGEAVLF